MEGYIYILKNSRLHGLVKIGYTTTSVQERVGAINQATGVAEKFEIFSFYKVNDAQKMEAIIHKKLTKYRTKTYKEFFEIKAEVAKDYVEKIINNENYGINLDSLNSRLFNNSKILGEIIKSRRKALNITQQDLRIMLGTGNRVISDIENGKPTAQIGIVLRVLEALNIKIAICND
jgi:y4mF family transcriptional regulator